MDSTENKKLKFNPRNFAQAWLQLSDIEITGTGALKKGNQRCDKSEVYATAYLDYIDQVTAHNALERANKAPKHQELAERHKKNILDLAFEEIIAITKEQKRKEFIDSMRCTGESLVEIQKVNQALGGSELDLQVLSHWAWQIKRKALNLPVYEHIAVVLYSEVQGVGKSTAIQKLIAPLADYTIDLNFAQLTDERYCSAAASSLVVRIEELAGWSTKAQLESLKNFITAPALSFRKLHGHECPVVTNYASIIGSTNKHLNTIITDTQNRRFHQIDIQSINHELINSIDYNALFAGIDERKEKGYLHGEVLAQLRKSQQRLATQSPIDQFLESINLAPAKNGKSKLVQVDVIYRAYRSSTVEAGFSKPLTSIALGRELSNRGFPDAIVKTIGKRSVKCRAVAEDCALSGEV